MKPGQAKGRGPWSDRRWGGPPLGGVRHWREALNARTAAVDAEPATVCVRTVREEDDVPALGNRSASNRSHLPLRIHEQVDDVGP